MISGKSKKKEKFNEDRYKRLQLERVKKSKNQVTEEEEEYLEEEELVREYKVKIRK